MNGATFTAIKFDSNMNDCFDTSISSKSDNVTVVQQTPRLTQFINHANYKIIAPNVTEWANVTKKFLFSHLPTLFFPLTSMRCTRQFRDRECILVPRCRAPFSTNQKERGLWGRECLEWQAMESHCWHSTACWKCVIPVSWTLIFFNKFSVFEDNEDVKRWTTG